jgi:uncharacterized protein YcbK (DUF882 family)
MERRHFLSGATSLIFMSGTAVSWAEDSKALDTRWRHIDPVLDLSAPNTGDALKVRFHGSEGYDLDAIALVNWFMRDWREDSIRPVDVKLLWGLAAMRSRFMKDGHDGSINIFSGYRTRRTNDLLRRQGRGVASRSLHLQARAIDFVFPGIRTRDIAKEASSLSIGGVGHYPRSGFVHIDTGSIRSW